MMFGGFRWGKYHKLQTNQVLFFRTQTSWTINRKVYQRKSLFKKNDEM